MGERIVEQGVLSSSQYGRQSAVGGDGPRVGAGSGRASRPPIRGRRCTPGACARPRARASPARAQREVEVNGGTQKLDESFVSCLEPSLSPTPSLRSPASAPPPVPSTRRSRSVNFLCSSRSIHKSRLSTQHVCTALSLLVRSHGVHRSKTAAKPTPHFPLPRGEEDFFWSDRLLATPSSRWGSEGWSHPLAVVLLPIRLDRTFPIRERAPSATC